MDRKNSRPQTKKKPNKGPPLPNRVISMAKYVPPNDPNSSNIASKKGVTWSISNPDGAVMPMLASIRHPRHANVTPLNRVTDSPKNINMTAQFQPPQPTNTLQHPQYKIYDQQQQQQEQFYAMYHPSNNVTKQQMHNPTQHQLRIVSGNNNKNSRIPTTIVTPKAPSTVQVQNQQNVQQITKMATNLLSDIYGKHLLNHTTFENVNTINLNGINSEMNARMNDGANVHITTTNNNNNNNYNNNNNHKKMINPNNNNVWMNKQFMEIKSTRTNELIYETITNENHHIYEKIDETKNGKKINANSGVRVMERRTPPVGRDSSSCLPTEGHNQQSKTVVMARNDTKIDYHLINSVLNPDVISYFQQKVSGNKTNSAQVYHQQQQQQQHQQYNQNLPVLLRDPNNSINQCQSPNNRINIMLETAQALQAAAYLERAAQRISNSTNTRTRAETSAERGGFCGVLQRFPPPLPAALTRRLANRENMGFGKVKVMLRVSDNPPAENPEKVHHLTVDKKKRQVTLNEPSLMTSSNCAQERAPMVSAPKMFAFDSLFTAEDSQNDVCSSALSEVIPAVLEGSDGCVLSLGYPGSGQTRTMVGSIASPNDLGVIPCAISWLYKGINEKRQKSGARFSVRVSALGVNATKPGTTSKDLLESHAAESDESPGIYLREDFLGGPTELRASTAERAALFFDEALSLVNRTSNGQYEPAFIFTLHVYQYSLAGKGGVAGGRSRLHLIDVGGCANRLGGLPLSGVGNVLLSILSGQRHPPNRDHPLTPLLKDCLAPLTCHVSIVAHILHDQSHADALTTIQLASRIHRMRRRKHRYPVATDKNLLVNGSGHQSGGSSGGSGPDPSSSDLSADTVIYMGPCGEQTDGEHPPVYLPSLSSGDQRCSMGKVLKGSGLEKLSKSPMKKIHSPKCQSPTPQHRTDSLKRNQALHSSSEYVISTQIASFSATSLPPSSQQSSPKIVAGAFQQPCGVSRGSNIPTPKGSPMRRSSTPHDSPVRKHKKEEEKWIDGPRVSRTKIAEARHLLREINHVKNHETWIDGPNTAVASTTTATTTALPALPHSANQIIGYGFMDSHKKSMIRQWVENQTSQVFPLSQNSSPTHQQKQLPQQLLLQQQQIIASIAEYENIVKIEDDRISINSKTELLVHPKCVPANILVENNCSESSLRSGQQMMAQTETQTLVKPNDNQSEKSAAQSSRHDHNSQEEEDEDSGPSEVPPALPLMDPLGSREISHESIHMLCSRHISRESLSYSQQNIVMMDCALQVTEEDIARTMGCEHPLSALSHGDMSVVSSFRVGDAFSDCVGGGDSFRNQFDQLARLREIFTSQLAMAEVTPVFRNADVSSVYSEPAFRFNVGPGSVCSEPAYRPPSPRCNGCRQSFLVERSPSQTSLPSLNGIVAIACMEQYASLRHPDGASDPNLENIDKIKTNETDINDHIKENPLAELDDRSSYKQETRDHLPQLPLLPISTPEAYDSGHDSTPRTSKHSGISRRAESGYHSVATVRDSDESSFGSRASRSHHQTTKSNSKKSKRSDKSLCHWLRNPFTCTYPDTEGEVSDF